VFEERAAMRDWVKKALDAALRAGNRASANARPGAITAARKTRTGKSVAKKKTTRKAAAR
jgi:hypothetical protein